jgi:RimJ/RimL family protein N-acetyltransferase
MSNQPAAPANVTLRPVTENDQEFLVELYATTRAQELAMVPWSIDQQQAFVRAQFSAQQDHYRQKYPDASHDIIVTDDRQVGRLYVGRLEREIRIVDITLLPAERNAGIGSYLIQQLLDEAKRDKKLTRIYVEEFNPSLRLFDRLGFSVREQQGIHLLLEWSPSNSSGS